MIATAGGEVQVSLTQTQLIWRDFKRHRAALAGGIIIALLYLMALGAEFIAPYDPYHPGDALAPGAADAGSPARH